MANYYVNSTLGSDENDGLSPKSPFQTLEKANSLILQPGDRLLFACGCTWEGALEPKGKGSVELPCIIEPYGSGPRPCIHGCGKVGATVLLYNTEGWVIRGFEITNQGEQEATGERRIGILALAEDYGTATGITIEDNYVHDVNGSNVKAHGPWAGGIFCIATANSIPTRFDTVRIRRNHLVRCDRVGIYISGAGSRMSWNPMLDVQIFSNLLEDIGGDGILNIRTDGCIVERNRLLGSRMRDDRYCAGIWPYSADNTIFRLNEAAYAKGTRDGQGFDCDGNCVGTIFEYNYSHDNDGGFMLVCTENPNIVPFHEMENPTVGCVSSQIYRNLTVNDLCRTFHLAGPVVGTVIEENCVYVGEHLNLPILHYTGAHEGMGPPEQTMVLRNIFAARGNASYVQAVERYQDGTFSHELCPNPRYVIYCGNAYLGNHAGQPVDPAKPVESPSLEQLESILLDENGKAIPGLETLDAFCALMGWEPGQLCED